VKTAGELLADLRRACYFAETVPRGPTLLGIPFEILMSPVPFARQPKLTAYPMVAPPEQLGPVAEILAQSNNPVIITEHAGRTAEEVSTLIKLAELLAAPVFEFWMPSFENFPRAHPLHGSGPVEAVLPEADCIVVAGANAPWHPPLIELKEGCKVIVFEEDPLRPRAPYWGYRTDYCIAGDVGMNLSQLYSRLKERLTSTPTGRAEYWNQYNRRNSEQARQQAAATGTAGVVPAAALFEALQQALPADSAIVDEIVAQTGIMVQTLFQSKSFKQYRGWAGALGTGLPTALGVKLAKPDNVVVCVIGDGAFSYNPIPACFGLAQQYKLPILVVICNNQGYTSQAWNVQKYFPEGAAVRTDNYYGRVIDPTPDYWKLAAAFGGYGERVGTPEALAPAIQRALAAIAGGQFAVLDVLVTP
jgi:acetolactate synthase-1/2/3 large subunit